MSRTFKELLEERTTLRQTKAVYDQVVTDLERFVPDFDSAPSSVIQADELGTVPRELIEDVIKTIKTEHLEPLEHQIEELENLEIQDEQQEQEAAGEEGAEESRAGEGPSQGGGKRNRQAGPDRVGNGAGQPKSGKVQIRNRQ